MTLDNNGINSSHLSVEQAVGVEANNLGYRYYTDQGIDQDYEKAASYFKLAIGYGDSAGHILLWVWRSARSKARI